MIGLIFSAILKILIFLGVVWILDKLGFFKFLEYLFKSIKKDRDNTNKQTKKINKLNRYMKKLNKINNEI